MNIWTFNKQFSWLVLQDQIMITVYIKPILLNKLNIYIHIRPILHGSLPYWEAWSKYKNIWFFLPNLFMFHLAHPWTRSISMKFSICWVDCGTLVFSKHAQVARAMGFQMIKFYIWAVCVLGDWVEWPIGARGADGAVAKRVGPVFQRSWVRFPLGTSKICIYNLSTDLKPFMCQCISVFSKITLVFDQSQ